jgi:hypothetical protein
MSWQVGYGLLRLLSEERYGSPQRLADVERKAAELSAMRKGLEEMR